MIFHKPIQLLSAGVALSIAGLGVALISAALLAEGYAAKSWPTTDAQIIRSEVVVSQKAAGGRRRGAVFTDFHQAKIEYQYTVNGKDFVGDELAIGSVPEGFDPSIANAAVAKYPVGSTVTISYNPADPDSAVIDPTVDVTLWWAGVALGLVSLTAGAIFWIKAIKIDDAERAAAVVATAPKPAKVRLQTVVDASLSESVQRTVEVPMHWFLRTIAVVIGVVFLLFGGLSLMVFAQMGVPAPNANVPAGVGVAAHIITGLFMVAFVMVGAILVRIGVQRRVRRITVRSAETAIPPVQSINRSKTQMPDFGDFIAQCGPREDGQTHYIVCGAGMIVLGILACFFPIPFPLPKGADISDATFQTICCVIGGVFGLMGLGMLWKPLFGQSQMILLYERGLIERVGSTNYAIPLDEIEQLRVQEFYEHRFAPRTFLVRAKVRGAKELSFSSALRGDSNRIIAYLAEQIPQTELVPFQA